MPTQFKDLVKDVSLETRDLRFDVMCNMFIKANALNTNEVREQRINSRKTAAARVLEAADARPSLRAVGGSRCLPSAAGLGGGAAASPRACSTSSSTRTGPVRRP